MSRDLIQQEILDNLPEITHGLLQLAPRVGYLKIFSYICTIIYKLWEGQKNN